MPSLKSGDLQLTPPAGLDPTSGFGVFATAACVIGHLRNLRRAAAQMVSAEAP